MRRLTWQCVVPLSLIAIVAIGLSGASRADDHPAADHGDAAHADDHNHAADGADHADGDTAHPAGEHGEHAAGDELHVDTSQPPIQPNRSMFELFVFSLAFFLLYVFLAKKLAWLPMIAGLDARESRVNRALADAEAARIGATRLLEDHQKQLDKVTEEVKEIISKARTEAEQEKARIIAQAETETTAMRDQAVADIHAAREQSLAGLDERIDSQIATATEHVLG